MNCPKCGKQVPDGVAFCDGCGAAMNQGKGGPNWLLIGCVGLLLLVMLGVAGFFGARWWRSRGDAPPAPITQPDQNNELEIVEPEGGTTTTPSDEPDDHEGGVHLDDEGNARQLVMDLFSMWSEGDEDGIKATMTPGTLAATEDYDFDSAYEQFSVEIIEAREAWAGTWRFVIMETYEGTEGERSVSEYEVAISKSQGKFMVSSLRTFEDGDSSGEDEEEDEASSYYIALMTVSLFFSAWEKGDVDGVRAQMTPELAADTDDDLFDDAYEQVDLDIENAKVISRDQWEFKMIESYRPLGAEGGDDTVHAIYRIDIVRTDAGWKVQDWEKLN